VVPQGKVYKGYRHGTDRLVPPATTLDRIRPLLPAMGITRVANVTGLDVIGIPVVMACRPNSRGLAVAQGKGPTLDAAKVSAIMESIECHHAENVALPLALATYDQLRADRQVIEADRLATVTENGAFRPDRRLLWVEGRDLVDDSPVWVPYDAVHADFTDDGRVGAPMFDVTSHGLASGNHLLEATGHALCELIERDATARWLVEPAATRQDSRVDLATVDDEACGQMIERIRAAGLAVMVWEQTSAVGLPVFFAVIAEDPTRSVLPLYPAGGYGCHPRREIAMLRAVSEAVQGRLTVIAGSRDDLVRADYRRFRDRWTLDEIWREAVHGRLPRSFRDAPTFRHASFDEDVALAVGRLRASGSGRVVRVDLSRPDRIVSVVRVVVEGLRVHESGPSAGLPRRLPHLPDPVMEAAA
jgi:YcaO-like protein with predicted kinase domain